MKPEHLCITVTTARYTPPKKKLHFSNLLGILLKILWDKLWTHNQNPCLGVKHYRGPAKGSRSRQRFRKPVAWGILWYLWKSNFGVWGEHPKPRKEENKKGNVLTIR
jgi:hypothetical protein